MSSPPSNSQVVPDSGDGGPLNDELADILNINESTISRAEYWVILRDAYAQVSSRVEANNCPRESLKEYVIDGVLGKGFAGEVFKVTRKACSQSFAMKLQNKAKIAENCIHVNVVREKKLMYAIQSPFIVKAHFVYQDIVNLYMVMDLAEYGDLKRCLEEFQEAASEELIKLTAAQIILGLEYLHSCHYMHNDLSTENIVLFRDGYFKLSDLGLVKSLNDPTYVVKGVPGSLSPEAMKQRLGTSATDWWHFGAIINELLLGRTARQRLDDSDTNFEITVKGEDFPKIELNENLTDFMSQVLKKDPTRRLGALQGGADDIKNHAWFKDIDFFKLYHKKIPMEDKLPDDIFEKKAKPPSTNIAQLLFLPDKSVFDEY